MKKIILCVLAVILTAVLIALIVWSGANTGPGPTTSGQDTTASQNTSASTGGSETTEATEPGVEIQIQSPMVSISLPILTETDTADDGTAVFRRVYQDVVLSIADAQVAQKVTVNLLKKMDGGASLLSQIQKDAFADYTGQEYFQSYYYEILFQPVRIDEAVLSLYGTEDIFSSTQSGRKGLSVTYSLITGAALTLGDVLTEEGNAAQALLEALLDILEAKKEDLSLFDDYASTITDRFQSDLQREDGWYFSSEGLCLFYSPYDIAPNASGIVIATVPYSQLTGILQDIYFPAEQGSFPGSLSGQGFASADLDRFTQFSELIVKTGAPRYLLQTDGVLYDVTVEQGQWVSGERYYSKAVIYAANRLSPKEGLVIQDSLPGASGTLRIRYRSGDESYQFYITLDASGNVAFTPAA